MTLLVVKFILAQPIDLMGASKHIEFHLVMALIVIILLK